MDREADLSLQPLERFRDSLRLLDCSIRLWDTSGKLLWTSPAQPRRLNSVVFSPEGTSFLSGSVDGSVVLWRLPDNRKSEK
jgi:WD40 repeat protein